MTLAGLYYQSEQARQIKEQKFESRIVYIECKNIARLMGPMAPKCDLQKDTLTDMSDVIVQLLILFVVASLLFVVMSWRLAKYSMAPIEEATQMIDMFIGHIVHDISTPISGILLNANSLKKEASPKALKKIDRIIKSAEQIVDLEEDLLLLIKNQKKSFTVSSIALEKEIQDICLLFEKSAFKLDLEATKVQIDKLHLSRILHNIIGNAVKYNQENLPIEIHLKNGKLSIKDRGIGIEDTIQVFDSFYREATNIKGTGLGLSVVKSLCDEWKIDIVLISELGKGSEFSLDFAYTLSTHKSVTL